MIEELKNKRVTIWLLNGFRYNGYLIDTTREFIGINERGRTTYMNKNEVRTIELTEEYENDNGQTDRTTNNKNENKNVHV